MIVFAGICKKAQIATCFAIKSFLQSFFLWQEARRACARKSLSGALLLQRTASLTRDGCCRKRVPADIPPGFCRLEAVLVCRVLPPHACPLGMRIAQRCSNLQLAFVHCVLLYLRHSVFLPCVSCRFCMACVSCAVLVSFSMVRGSLSFRPGLCPSLCGAAGALPVHAVPGEAHRCGLEAAAGCARHP